jgi:hypothetical protein
MKTQHLPKIGALCLSSLPILSYAARPSETPNNVTVLKSEEVARFLFPFQRNCPISIENQKNLQIRYAYNLSRAIVSTDFLDLVVHGVIKSGLPVVSSSTPLTYVAPQELASTMMHKLLIIPQPNSDKVSLQESSFNGIKNVLSPSNGIVNAVILQTIWEFESAQKKKGGAVTVEQRLAAYDILWDGSVTPIPSTWTIGRDASFVIARHLNSKEILSKFESLIPKEYLVDGMIDENEVLDYFQRFLKAPGDSLVDKIALFFTEKISKNSGPIQEFLERETCATCCCKCLKFTGKSLVELAKEINWGEVFTVVLQIVAVVVVSV